jgi:hypothetical protein
MSLLFALPRIGSASGTFRVVVPYLVPLALSPIIVHADVHCDLVISLRNRNEVRH